MKPVSVFKLLAGRKTLFALSAVLSSISSFAQGLESPCKSQSVLIQHPANERAWQQSHVLATTAPGKNSMSSVGIKKVNFTSFLPVMVDKSPEVMAHNKGFENDPEVGVLYADAPCSDCYEILSERTATQKYFVKKGTNATKFVLQSNNLPIHYKDETGRWRTIDNHLENAGTGTYSTKGRNTEVTVNTEEGSTTLSCAGESITYNRNLELICIKPDGSEQSMGSAEWHNHTEGENGMSVKDAWPGIDIEISILPNSLKTDFIINRPLIAFAGCKLVIRDHMQLATGLTISQAKDSATSNQLSITNAQDEPLFVINKAVAYEENSRAATSQSLSYSVNGNNVDINVPGEVLNKPLSSYPIVIDPLVSGTILAGFSFSETFADYPCLTTNNVTIPAGATLSDIQLTYTYQGISFANFSDAGVEYAINGGCYTGFLSCSGVCDGLGSGATACGMTSESFWDGTYASWGTSGCLPAFSCSSYTLPFQLLASQNYYSLTGSCSQTVFATSTGFTVDVYGSVPETPSITSSTGSDLLCMPSTLSLTGFPSGGTWSSSIPLVGTVSSVGVVTGIVPGVTTISYSTSTGSCGTMTAYAAVTVKNPPTVAPVSGTDTFCQGLTLPFSDTSTGGVWSSSNTAVATVNSSGNVTGVGGGTATISYTIDNGCGTVYATQDVAINPLPIIGPISGPSGVCIGDTISLSDTAAGGVWSSSMTSVATTNSLGIVTGLVTGTTTITYAVTNSCGTESSTLPVVVDVTPTVDTISGTTSVCAESTITLSDATAGGTWVSGMPGVALVASTGNVTGVSSGTAVISYENSSACAIAVATKTVTVNPVYTGVYVISTIAGNGTAGYSGDGGSPTSAEINDVYGIGVNPAGQIYLADYGNSVIRGIGGGAIVTVLTDPYSPIIGVAADHFGNVYATELTSGRILKCNATSTTAFTTELEYPTGICTDKYGNVYVASQLGYGVYEFDSTGTLLTSGASAPGEVTGVAVDTVGNLYFSCWNLEYVWRQDHVTGVVTVIAGNGTAGFSGDGGPATDAEINQPYSIATDQAGNVYIADVSNYRIRKVDIVTGIISTIAGTGISGYNGDGIVATTANIAPNDVFIDNSGNVLMSDAGNNRIRKLTNTIPPITGATTVCIGDTTVLSDTSYIGGIWSTSNAVIATVNASTGVVTGLTVGTTNINYTLSSICSSINLSHSITVEAANAGTIAGAGSLCLDSSIIVTDGVSGGTWGSILGNVTVSASGEVTGVISGIDTITYTAIGSCGVAKAKHPITVEDCADGVNSIVTGTEKIIIFPNPNSGKFIINVSSGQTEQVRLEIKNIIGETVGKHIITSNKDTQILLNQPPGVYMLTVYSLEKTYSLRITLTK